MLLKSKRVVELALGLVDGVAHLLVVDLGDDVEAGMVADRYPAATIVPASGVGARVAKGSRL